MKKKKRKTFLVNFWGWILDKLLYVSTLEILRLFIPFTRTYFFVEVWIVINSIIALLFFLFERNYGFIWCNRIIIIYGFIRVTEIFIFQLYILLFHDYREIQENKKFKIRSYRRLIITLIHNYIEIALWFSGFYIFFNEDINISFKYSLLENFVESLKIMFTFNSDKINARTEFGYILMSYHIVIGGLMTLLALSRFIGLIPVFKSMDENEK